MSFKLLKVFVLFMVIFSVLVPQFVFAQQHGTAVLIDISGSMKNYGPNWQNDVQRTVADLLFGGILDENVWRVEGINDANFLAQLRNGHPLYHPNQFLLILHFGEIVRDSDPWFRNLEIEAFSDLNRARDFYNRHFPRTFNDQWTYLNLAKAAARNEFVIRHNIRNWHFILISDVDTDTPPRQAQRFVEADKIATEYPTTVNEQEKLTFSYTNNARLKMIISEVIYLVRDTSDAIQPPVTSINLIKPANGKKIDRVDKRNTLSFRWKSVEGIRKYTLVLRDSKNKIIMRRISSRPTLSYNQTLKSDRYNWSVEGKLEQGGKAISRPYSFQVTGSGDGAFLWFLLIAILGGSGYYFFTQWQKKRKIA